MPESCRPSWPPVLALLALAAPGLADTNDLAVAEALQKSYDRCHSKIMVRIISHTGRASLDYAAHDRNPLFHYPMPQAPTAPAATPELDALDFDGALIRGSIRDRTAETPLTDDELARPLAWQPVLKYLCEWNYDAAEPLLVTGSKVSGEKWGNDDLVRPLQQVSTAYLHGDEVWVKIEFRPEVSWLAIDDEDGDAYAEIYGRIDPGQHAADVLKQIRADYLTEQLPSEEVETYFFELASDWYQALQTVTLEPETTRPWPNDETEPEILKALGGKSFASPFAVIRGKPYGEVIYNVFLLAEGTAHAEQAAVRRVAQQGATTLVSDPWQDELRAWGGSWEAWSERLGEFHADVKRQLEARPAELKGLIGRDDFLFFRGDVEYLVSGDLRDQADGRDPYPAVVDFHQQLTDRDIDLLLVIIPTKADVFPEKLSEQAPEGARPYVAPYCRKLLSELAEAGVEIVDLLPAFIEERDVDGDLLYMPQDTHWKPRGVHLAAKLIAERVRQYPWYAALSPQQVSYSVRDAAFTRQGDICDMLTDQERLAYRPLKLTAQQVVTPDGELYVDDPGSPICMLGDSFTGVFHFEDCKHAGLSAHLAKELGMPIDLIMAQGSGPRIRGQLARRGHDAIEAKRLIIWTVVARDLYNYWAPWDIIKLP